MSTAPADARPATPDVPSLTARLPFLRQHWVRDLRSLVVPVGFVALLVTCVHVDVPDRVGGLGLATQIPWFVYVAMTVLSGSFVRQLHRGARGLVLGAHVAAAAFALDGIAGLLEEQPRFPTAWLHAGFVSVFAHSGHGSTVDARFFWPSFFTVVAYLIGATHTPDALGLLRFAPVVFTLAYVPPLLVIFGAVVPGRAARWLGVWAFLLADWVGQDYFSPQALAELVFLAVLAVTLTVLARRDDASELPLSVRVSALLVVVAALFALTTAHQFTPVVLALDLFGLWAVRSLRFAVLPWLAATFVLVWISWAAEPFWFGHLQTILGTGSVRATVHQGVVGRVRGSDGHEHVVWIRMAYAAGVWLLAGAGAWRAPRPRHRACLVLGVLPFLTLATQSYGGEAVLRVYLYTLPFLLAFALHLAVRGDGALTPRRGVVVTVVASLAVPVFYVARFGNEEFEQVRTSEVAAVEQLYDVAPPGATLAAPDPDVPWRYEHFLDYRYQVRLADAIVHEDMQRLRQLLPYNARGTYMLVTTASLAELTDFYGDRNWATRVPAFLHRAGFVRLWRNSDAQILRLQGREVRR